MLGSKKHGNKMSSIGAAAWHRKGLPQAKPRDLLLHGTTPSGSPSYTMEISQRNSPMAAEDLGEEQEQHGLVKQTAQAGRKGSWCEKSSHGARRAIRGKATEKDGMRTLGLKKDGIRILSSKVWGPGSLRPRPWHEGIQYGSRPGQQAPMPAKHASATEN